MVTVVPQPSANLSHQQTPPTIFTINSNTSNQTAAIMTISNADKMVRPRAPCWPGLPRLPGNPGSPCLPLTPPNTSPGWPFSPGRPPGPGRPSRPSTPVSPRLPYTCKQHAHSHNQQVFWLLKHLQNLTVNVFTLTDLHQNAFSAFMLLVRRQEEHPACKN